MELIRDQKSFLLWRSGIVGSLGLVPTMGNLHAGHLSLAQRSVAENDLSVLTIFVNPRQFGPNEDFHRYPRTLEKDLELLETLGKKLVVFAPSSPEEVFGKTEVPEMDDPLYRLYCGQSRPGHFKGVVEVVYQLFSLVRPTKAYFGLKDFQQFTILRRMVEKCPLPIVMEGMPIIRDHEGLALSSRNQYLTLEEKKEALTLPRTLQEARRVFEANEDINSFIKETLKDTRWDYLELCDAQNLLPPTPSTQEFIFLGAFKLGKTRLIDNLFFLPQRS